MYNLELRIRVNNILLAFNGIVGKLDKLHIQVLNNRFW